MTTLIIVADLGRVKALRIVREEDEMSPRIDEIADIDLENQHSRFANRDTDQAGRFPTGKTGMAHGERHGEEEQARQSQLKEVASAIEDIANGEAEAPIWLAAPQPIHQKLLASLDGDVRSRILKDLALDLVKVPKLELLKKFQDA